MRSSSLILILLLSPIGLAAQTNAGNTSAVFVLPPVSSSCPVIFTVDRRPNSGLEVVKGADELKGQGLQFTFRGQPRSAILKAVVVVHGMIPTVRAFPAASATSASAGPTESFVLTATAGSPLLHPSIWTQKMSVITWVELTRIEFANGTTWQPTRASQCAAAPSLYVPVSSAQ